MAQIKERRATTANRLSQTVALESGKFELRTSALRDGQQLIANLDTAVN
mgnify:CR=1 FL=1